MQGLRSVAALPNTSESETPNIWGHFNLICSERAKEIQEINRALAHKQGKIKDKNNEKKDKARRRKKGDRVHELTAEKNIPTNEAR